MIDLLHCLHKKLICMCRNYIINSQEYLDCTEAFTSNKLLMKLWSLTSFVMPVNHMSNPTTANLKRQTPLFKPEPWELKRSFHFHVSVVV